MAANSTPVNSPGKPCSSSRPGLYFFTVISILNILLLPLLIYVVYVAVKLRKRHHRLSKKWTHSDIFTYNMIAMELIKIAAIIFSLCGSYLLDQNAREVGDSLYSITLPGQTLLHVLTCLEHYLAVVHPITYLGLRQASGARIRNITIMCIWLLSFVLMVLSQSVMLVTDAFSTCLLGIAFVVSCYLSTSLLYVLKYSGPEEVDQDQMKRRLVCITYLIMAAIMLRFIGLLLSALMYMSSLPSKFRCVLAMSGSFFALPGVLVLPLLFLHRAGRLPGSKHRAPPRP